MGGEGVGRECKAWMPLCQATHHVTQHPHGTLILIHLLVLPSLSTCLRVTSSLCSCCYSCMESLSTIFNEALLQASLSPYVVSLWDQPRSQYRETAVPLLELWALLCQTEGTGHSRGL